MAYSYRGRRRSSQPRPFTWPASVVGVILVLVGLAVLAYWGNYIYQGNLSDGLATVENNAYIVYHIGAEAIVALLAVAGGFGLIGGRGWGMATSLAALGGLLYTSVNSLSHSIKNAPELTPVFYGVLGFTLLSFIALHFSRRY